MQKAMMTLVLAAGLTTSASALAQETEAEDDVLFEEGSTESTEESATNPDAPADGASPESEQAAPADSNEGEQAAAKDSKAKKSSMNGDDGARFRFGVAAGAGPLMVKDRNFDDSATAIYGGVDTRFGVQINDLIGVYAQPQVGFYNFKEGGPLATGGLLGVSVGGDVTFIHRFFVGAGLGYGILNNPGGLELHFRAGGYPLMGRSKEKVRRKGLMVGVDFRVHIVGNDAVKATAIAPTFNLGYEAF